MTRHPQADRLERTLAKCLGRAIPWVGELFRSTSPRYANRDDVLTGAGSKTAGARRNPPNSFRTIYTSLDVETAVAESLAHFRYYGLAVTKAMPRVLLAVKAKLRRVLDLTDTGTRRVLGVSRRKLLAEPWREEQKKGREALTQAVGRLAYSAGLEGLLVPSAAHDGLNLVIFPANLDPPTSWVRIMNKEELPPAFVPLR